MKETKAFEDQFRWEVDRWVFRYRQRGTPVEVSDLERQLLIERHRKRLSSATMMSIAYVFGAAIVVSFGLRTDEMVGLYAVCLYGSVAMVALMLHYWATRAVTMPLRKRIPVGEKLGFLGAWMMRVEATSWADAIAGCIVPPMAIAATYLVMRDPQFGFWYRLGMISLSAWATGVMTLLVVVKLMVDARERRRKAWRAELDAARELRVD